MQTYLENPYLVHKGPVFCHPESLRHYHPFGGTSTYNDSYLWQKYGPANSSKPMEFCIPTKQSISKNTTYRKEFIQHKFCNRQWKREIPLKVPEILHHPMAYSTTYGDTFKQKKFVPSYLIHPSQVPTTAFFNKIACKSTYGKDFDWKKYGGNIKKNTGYMPFTLKRFQAKSIYNTHFKDHGFNRANPARPQELRTSDGMAISDKTEYNTKYVFLNKKPLDIINVTDPCLERKN